jgi:hypothetical protein
VDKQHAIDKILETENLTESLEDTEATWLLNWGTRQVGALIAGLDDEAAGRKVSELMAVMRRTGQIISDREAKTTGELVEDLALLAKAYLQAFGRVRALGSAERKQVAARIAGQPPRLAIEHLLNRLKPEDKTDGPA